MQVRPVEPADAAAICDIYNHYIEHTTITFEEVPLAPAEMAARIEACTKSHPWLVCVDEGAVVGYAYAGKWKERAAYRPTAEATVYVRAGLARRGCGQALYAALLPAVFERGCHVLLGCIALPNAASVALHERFGFRKVAHFNQVGRKFDQWIDVGYWQLLGGGRQAIEADAASIEEQSKAVVRLYVEAFNRGDLEGLKALLADDAEIQGVMGQGLFEKIAPVWRQLIEGYGMRLEITGLVAQGNVVAARFVERGTFRAPAFGNQPTGKSYELVAMEWFEVEGGRIRRRWGARDAASQARQLGIAPP